MITFHSINQNLTTASTIGALSSSRISQSAAPNNIRKFLRGQQAIVGLPKIDQVAREEEDAHRFCVRSESFKESTVGKGIVEGIQQRSVHDIRQTHLPTTIAGGCAGFLSRDERASVQAESGRSPVRA